MLAVHLEVVWEQAREIGEVMQCGPADAPAGIIDIAIRVLTFEQKGPACRLDPPSPEVRADEIARLPVRSLLEHHNLLARLRQHGGKHRAGSPRADDDDVYFLVRHATTSSPLLRRGDMRHVRDTEVGIAIHGPVHDIDRIAAKHGVYERARRPLPALPLVLAHIVHEAALLRFAQLCKGAPAVEPLARAIYGSKRGAIEIGVRGPHVENACL